MVKEMTFLVLNEIIAIIFIILHNKNILKERTLVQIKYFFLGFYSANLLIKLTFMNQSGLAVACIGTILLFFGMTCYIIRKKKINDSTNNSILIKTIIFSICYSISFIVFDITSLKSKIVIRYAFCLIYILISAFELLILNCMGKNNRDVKVKYFELCFWQIFRSVYFFLSLICGLNNKVIIHILVYFLSGLLLCENVNDLYFLKEKVKSVNYSKYVFLGITFGIILNNFI